MPARLAGRCPPPPLMTHAGRSVSRVPCSTGVPPRGAHGEEVTVTVWVGGGGTTLYLLPGLVVPS